ncbi:transferase [Radiomyces spectabilis]|uniref:transferase n=1 Tax=Radiomyces spectabilis TaxID=64574 RepID=UPI00221E9FF2|nr:transferase [Radiomyces spectabilis]KAI8364670.1 transferase [Radiomyces spectabilis]
MVPQPHLVVTHREWVKPTVETPDHLRRTPLSDWDIVMFKSYTPLLIFYANNDHTPNFMNTRTLTESLSQVLEDFYPLAGRLVDIGNGRDEIDCCDAGVLFQEAEYNESLETFREAGYLPNQMDYHHMFPIHFYRSARDPLLAIQVNRFKDGGVALAVMILHKVADNYSACFFLDAWAKRARGVKYVQGNFQRDLVAVPPSTVITDEAIAHYREEHRVYKEDATSHIVRVDPNQSRFSRTSPIGPKPLKSVILEFYSDGLQLCKKDAHTTEMILSRNWLSTKDALFAMLLRAIVRCREIPEDQPVKMVLSVNGRSKMKNQKEMDYYFGNWMISRSVATTKREVEQTCLAYTAATFRQKLASLKASLFHSISKLYTMHEDMTVHYLSYQSNSNARLTASDVSMLPFWRLDFGFGRPDRTRGYITFGGNGCLIVFGRSDGNKGAMYDVQLQMDADSIGRFIKDPEVRKYSRRILY